MNLSEAALLQRLLPHREVHSSGTEITTGSLSSYYSGKDGSFQRKSELKHKSFKVGCEQLLTDV